MLAPVLGELSRHRQRPTAKIKEIVSQVEPHVLPRPNLTRDQHESLDVIREPRGELVQLFRS